jgi:alpha-galactosidase
MGFNDWNNTGSDYAFSHLRPIADSIISTGLREVGYVYICRDGWGPKPENGVTNFNSTFKPWADWLHANGLKCGCYTQRAPSTDAQAKEVADAVAAAGVDYIKHDAWTTASMDPSWRRMSAAILATGRPIVYSTNSHPDTNDVTMWRTGGDINPSWTSISANWDANYTHLSMAGPGHWPDIDMMEVGCTYGPQDSHHTPDEDQSHFSMWCIVAAPLIAGCNFSRMSPFGKMYTDEDYARSIRIHGNAEVVAVDQDSLCKPGRRIKGQGALEVWIKDMKDGSKAVMLFNRTAAAADMSISQADLGWSTASQIYIRDLWTHSNLTPFTGTYTKNVNTHVAEMYRMSTRPIDATRILRRMDRNISWLKRNGIDLFPTRLIPGVMQGADVRMTAFDLRGRAVTVDSHLAGAGMFVLRYHAAAAPAVKFIWPGSPVAGR